MFCCIPTGLDYNNQSMIRILKLLVLTESILGIVMLSIDIPSGLELLLGSVILSLSIWTKNWCSFIFYITLTLHDGISSVSGYSQFFSNTTDLALKDYVIILSLLKYPLFLVSVFYTFQAYKDLKALFIEKLEETRENSKW